MPQTLWIETMNTYCIGDSYRITLPSTSRIGLVIASKPGAILVKYLA